MAAGQDGSGRRGWERPRSRLTGAEKREPAQLRRDKKRLEMENEILKRPGLPPWPDSTTPGPTSADPGLTPGVVGPGPGPVEAHNG